MDLWNALELNAQGDYLGLLNRIAALLYDQKGILVNICAAQQENSDDAVQYSMSVIIKLFFSLSHVISI
jgi:hypothetical protein